MVTKKENHTRLATTENRKSHGDLGNEERETDRVVGLGLKKKRVRRGGKNKGNNEQ